jgi:membrane fusion protein, multidrug efflux system
MPLPVGRRMPRLWLLACVAMVVLAGAGAYARYYWDTGRFLKSTDDAYVQADSTIVAPKVSGDLREVLVDDNQRVNAGQVVARIGDREGAATLDQAKPMSRPPGLILRTPGRP